MLSESVAQKPIMADSDGTKTFQNAGSVCSVPGCASRGPRPFARQIAQATSAPVITST
jgi:hypothetical protein